MDGLWRGGFSEGAFLPAASGHGQQDCEQRAAAGIDRDGVVFLAISCSSQRFLERQCC